MMRRARWIYPALVCVLIAIYYAVPPARVAMVAVVGVLSAGTVVWSTRVRRPVRSVAWLLLGLGLLIVAAGEVSYNVLAAGGQPDNFPSGPDWLYLLAYPALAVGLLWLGMPRSPSHDWPGAIEITALTLAGSLIVWMTLILPTLSSVHMHEMGKVVLIAGWVGDVLILSAALRLVMVWPRKASAWLLCGAVVALFAGDVRYGVDLLNGRWVSGGPSDYGLLVFFALAGAAALVPSMTSVGFTRMTKHRLALGNLVTLAVALLVAPTVLLAAASPGPVTVPVAIVAAAVGMLVIMRLAMAITEHRRFVARDAVIRGATRDLGLAMTEDSVLASLESAFAEMTGDQPTQVRLDTSPPSPPRPQELRVPVPPGTDDEPVSRAIVYEGTPADLAELQDELTGLADQAAIALQRIDLAERVRASEQEQNVLAYRASHDGLTGLANADLFRSQLRLVARSATVERLTAVLFIDLDDFKNINDTLGHEAGDAVLVATAQRIRDCLRSEDLGARLGGDEFAVLLSEITDDASAYVVARRLTEALSEPTMIGGIPVICRASVGLATAGAPDQFDALLRRADTALYAAKAAGKGRWRPYEPEMQSPLRRGSDLRAELERALRPAPGDGAADSRGLTMHYQPIVDLTTGRVSGFEALIRWEHPRRGTVKVPELIALAEHTGLILPLGEWVCARAFQDGHALAEVHEGIYISVNVSVAQLRLTGFTDRIREQLASSPLEPSRVVVEITESQLVGDDERIWDDLAELRKTGVRVAIDDYGTGYASLSYLRHPVIDIVKLDRRFLDRIASERARALLRAVLGLTDELGLPLIAEGIEDEMTRATLLELGCAYGQGHLFAPAMPLPEALKFRLA
ncbi:MAG TPA: EAL domain-containing protein [Micromonosporaceae bacterium]